MTLEGSCRARAALAVKAVGRRSDGHTSRPPRGECVLLDPIEFLDSACELLAIAIEHRND